MHAESQCRVMDVLCNLQKNVFIDLTDEEDDVRAAIKDLVPACGCPDVEKKKPLHAVT